MTARLLDFCNLFALGDAAATERLTERLNLVLTDPTAYQSRYADELAERGIEAALPTQELRDVALIDALLQKIWLGKATGRRPLRKCWTG